MPINSLLYPQAKVPAPFEVSNSLRFNDGSSDTLQRTTDSSSSTKGTLSFWCKRSHLGTDQRFFNTNNVSDPYFQCFFRSGNDLRFQTYSGGASVLNFITNRLFRDVSAWYHIVITFDTTQATSTDRVKLYVNGVQETSFSTSTYPSQNANIRLNHGVFRIGGTSTGSYFDGYLAEVVYCDGQALDATSFGEFDEDTGIWKPIDVSGLTFGTNGFYLDFEDSSSLGNDAAGSNNFTVNNLTSIDQTTDTCTNNYATLNPLVALSTGAFSEGNCKNASSSSTNFGAVSTFGVSSGKWYAEFKPVSATGNKQRSIGVCGDITSNSGSRSDLYLYSFNTGGSSGSETVTTYENGTSTTVSYTGYFENDIVGVALDMDNNKVYFSVNGTWQNSADPAAGTNGISIGTSPPDGVFYFALTDVRGADVITYEANFGNPISSISSGNSDANDYGNFEYSVPSGYYALNSKNLAEYG